MQRHVRHANPFTRAVEYIADTTWVCIFSVLSTLLAPILLVRLPQGRELLNTLTDAEIFRSGTHWERPLHYGLFLLAFFAWGLANWYGSRVLLQRDFMTPRTFEEGAIDTGFRYRWNERFPRALGGVGMFIIASYILFARHQMLAGLGAMATFALFLSFVVYRRKLFKTGEMMDRSAFSDADKVALWLAYSLSFVLLLFMVLANWTIGRFLGTPVILFVGLGSMVIFGSIVFTYLPVTFGWPNLAWLPFAVALVLGLTSLNRNHAVASHLLDQNPALLPHREPVGDHFSRWLQARGDDGPIFLIAAEGGASRSAWWTSHVLTALDYASDGEFSRRVYAVSGVSGGSLGAATYVALLAARSNSAAPAQPATPLSFPTQEVCWSLRDKRQDFALAVQSECYLERDFLAPVFGYLMFPDLLQRFIPLSVGAWDRSFGLEKSWEDDWQTLFGGTPSRNPFANTIQALYGDKDQLRVDIPVLLLNSTRAGAGRAVLQSPLIIASSEMDDLLAENLNARSLPLSALVHNSARFPIISPGGDVDTAERRHWDTLVDGGYFENSGAAALAEMIRAIDLCVQGPECRLKADDWEKARRRIHLIFIMNEPDERDSVIVDPASNTRQYAASPLIPDDELLVPLEGLYSTRTARGDSSKRGLISLLSAADRTHEIFMTLHDGPSKLLPSSPHGDEPAMSWYLNDESRFTMWRSLARPEQKQALCRVVESFAAAKKPGCMDRLAEFGGATGEGT